MSRAPRSIGIYSGVSSQFATADGAPQQIPFLAARQRHKFAVMALTPAEQWTGGAGRKNRGLEIMDKDRIKGSVEQAKGSVKEAVGKATGDAKLEVEGRNEKAAGKVQNAVGGVKDEVREAVRK